MSLRLQRANFLVRNLERALAFYRDVLGFEVAFVQAPRQAGYSHRVFGIDRRQPVRFATLSAPNQERVMALTEVADLPPQSAPRRAAIVLDVADIDAVVARAKAQEFQVFPEERLLTHDGRVGREVGLLDADGNLSVIYNIPAEQQKPSAQHGALGTKRKMASRRPSRAGGEAGLAEPRDGPPP